MSDTVLYENALYTKARRGLLCKAFVVRMVTNPLIIHFAKNAGFELVWVEMEHSTYSTSEACVLTSAAMMAGITPIVRVPYECGMGYVQRVLDSGAMGVVFPHIVTAADAEAAVQMCKFPPRGRRSLWLQQAAAGLRTSMPMQTMADDVNATASAVGVMIEAVDSIPNVDAIAAVDGVDMLVVGCMDLSADMGAPGMTNRPEFRAALEAVSAACRRHNKIFGLAGSYKDLNFLDWVINTLGVRMVLGYVDSNLLSAGAGESIKVLSSIDRTALSVPDLGSKHDSIRVSVAPL
ncbi:Pyruvate/Phosphoenolpyruvate kinase-like domain-containing protein [Chaetomium fimeti]|uniref:Pyruvate/Phosphoenolpyruvate kinase-like domain-containing protein n=1 Tax=Chaetomium fimeti TaxID=1854472 RepID=A0AAE0H5B1_9PEZI|nr:Pyruvate/Phosphoenolpyruvate kinase-like domain-containing protein [Chaetomium fimeti]